jgi:hypothetical protein
MIAAMPNSHSPTARRDLKAEDVMGFGLAKRFPEIHIAATPD